MAAALKGWTIRKLSLEAGVAEGRLTDYGLGRLLNLRPEEKTAIEKATGIPGAFLFASASEVEAVIRAMPAHLAEKAAAQYLAVTESERRVRKFGDEPDAPSPAPTPARGHRDASGRI